MKHAIKIAGVGLLIGTVVTLAAAPASARGPFGGGMAGHGGFGGPGGLFAQTFAEIDANGDGQITEEDLLAGAQARFADVDTDGNGLLSAEEFAASATARVEERMQGRAVGPRGMNPDTMADRMAARILENRDADGNGALSLAEMAPEKGFGRVIDRFDTDDDNAISEAEFDEAKAEMADRMARRENRGGHGGKRR